MLLYQETNGFLFNSDAHFLYDFVARFHPKGKLLDVGCGCGIIGLLLKRDFPVTLTGIDLQSHNVLLSRQNAVTNRLDATFIEGNFLHFKSEEKFDIILSNPPYYHTGATKSANSSVALSKSNTALPLEAFIAQVNRIIAPRGSLFFCYDAKQISAITTLLERYKFPINDLRFVHGTIDKPAHLVMVHAQKSSKALTKILPPLIHFEAGEMSQECKKIYQTTRTYSIKCEIL